MPGMKGPELAARLRALRPGLRVLLMSGYAADVVTAGDLKDATLLSKPFSPAALARAVRDALDVPAFVARALRRDNDGPAIDARASCEEHLDDSCSAQLWHWLLGGALLPGRGAGADQPSLKNPGVAEGKGAGHLQGASRHQRRSGRDQGDARRGRRSAPIGSTTS